MTKCINHPETDAVGVCLKCGKPICESCKVETGGEIYCKKCISEKAMGQEKKQKSPGLAAILSLIIGGAGQIYNGQPGKGLLIFFTAWLIIPWIYGIIDAYKTAEKINKGELSIPSRPGCVIAAIVVILLVPFFIAMLALLAAIAIPSFISAKNAAMANLCRNNMLILYTAKGQYALDNGLNPGDTIFTYDHNGTDDGDGIPDVIEEYLGETPKCPSGGTYTLGPIGTAPTCSIGDNNNKRSGDDHILEEGQK